MEAAEKCAKGAKNCANVKIDARQNMAQERI